MTKRNAITTATVTFRLLNRQRRDAVPLAWLGRFARAAARALHITAQRGRRAEFVIAFVDAATMRRLHGRFLHRRTMTDVLTFRYEEPEGFRPVAGELVIAPAAARAYAARHGVSYRHELARYVAHGLLHWLGHNDQTPMQQRVMRKREDQLLACCGR